MHVFAVSRVLLDKDGRVTAVHWGRVDTRITRWATAEAAAPVADVVRALHAGAQVFASEHGHLPDRRFIAVAYDNGWESIARDGPTTHARGVHDMVRMQS